jgi:hypothetical protein
VAHVRVVAGAEPRGACWLSYAVWIDWSSDTCWCKAPRGDERLAAHPIPRSLPLCGTPGEVLCVVGREFPIPAESLAPLDVVVQGVIRLPCSLAPLDVFVWFLLSESVFSVSGWLSVCLNPR